MKKLLSTLLALVMALACMSEITALGEDMDSGDATTTDLAPDEEYDEEYEEEYDELKEDPDPMIGCDVSGETVVVDGDADAEAHDQGVTAVNVTSMDGQNSAVTVKGSATARGTAANHSHLTTAGVMVQSSGQGSTASVTVGEGITSVMKWINREMGDNINVAGISVELEDGAAADVTVEQGGVYTEGSKEPDGEEIYSWAAGIHLYNTDSNAVIRVRGDVYVDSSNYGVGLNSHLYGEGGASTRIEVDGDVYGKTRAIWAEHCPDNAATMDIIVNGTVSGGTDCILVDGFSNGGLTLTIWKAIPGEDGGIIYSEGVIEDTERNEEAEKALQYIIRTSPLDEDKIQVEATDYSGYQVAREGETVRIRVKAPSGYEITGVFADEEQSIALEKDAEGNYFLVIPHGGGVELSVTTRKIPSGSDGADAAETAPVPEMVITDDTDETASMKEFLGAEDGMAGLPEDVRNLLPEGAVIREMLTLTLLNYSEDAEAPEFILPVQQQYAEGSEALVIFAIPHGESNSWRTVKAAGTAEGLLRIRPDTEALKTLSDATYLAIVCAAAE